MGAGSPLLTLPFNPERPGRQRLVSSTLLILQSQGEGGTIEGYCAMAQGLANMVITQSAQFKVIQ